MNIESNYLERVPVRITILMLNFLFLMLFPRFSISAPIQYPLIFLKLIIFHISLALYPSLSNAYMSYRL